jgi:hypothetical protein
MFIKINELPDEALAALKKAAPLQGESQMKKKPYEEAFQEFQRTTEFKYLDGLSYRRKKVFNPYKSDFGEDTMRKVIVDKGECSDQIMRKVDGVWVDVLKKNLRGGR